MKKKRGRPKGSGGPSSTSFKKGDIVMFKNETELKRFYKDCFLEDMRQTGFGFWSIEPGQGASLGLPDLVHPSKNLGNVYFPVEFKNLKLRGTGKIKLRPVQVMFHTREAVAGNRTFIIVGSDAGIFVFQGWDARTINNQNLIDVFQTAIVSVTVKDKDIFYAKMSEVLYG